jgi:IgA peptidase M64
LITGLDCLPPQTSPCSCIVEGERRNGLWQSLRLALRSRVCALIAVACCAIAPRAFSQATIQQILTNGPTSQRLNIVFLSEGYTSSQLGQFTNDAKNVLNTLLGTPPFNEYRRYFNAFAISIASAESGSDHPSRNISRNTYFNSSYDSFGLARLITINSTGEDRVNSLLQSFMPEYDIVILIVNDTEYGGSGGFPLITSVNQSSPDIAVHELGHSFSNLGDEYEDAFPGYPDDDVEPNTTVETNRALIKWNAWISESTPVPTPETFEFLSVVGLFEGAHYHSTGWFRPKQNCKMRSLPAPFCEICSEALVKSVYEQIRPVDSFSPATNQIISITNANSATFTVTPLVPISYGLSIQWFLNGVAVNGATSSVFTVTATGLPPGTNQVKAEIADQTAKVRTDPDMLLKELVVWQVNAVVTEPRLAVTQAGDQVTLSWSANAAGFRLETAGAIAPALNWTTLFTISNQTNVTLTVTNQNTFFRLASP